MFEKLLFNPKVALTSRDGRTYFDAYHICQAFSTKNIIFPNRKCSYCNFQLTEEEMVTLGLYGCLVTIELGVNDTVIRYYKARVTPEFIQIHNIKMDPDYV